MEKLPNDIEIRRAQFPQNYQSAKVALKECSEVDEAMEWADKAAAIATYARQSKDNALLNLAIKIKARAVRRAGELLKEFQTGPDGGRPTKNGAAAGPVSQRQAAADAGMSERQEKTAVRVANVPQKEFEAAVESENPPSVTQLAEAGKQPPNPPTILERGIDPEDFKEATKVHGALRSCAEAAQKHDPKIVVRGCLPNEYSKMIRFIETIRPWLDSLLNELMAKGESDDNR